MKFLGRVTLAAMAAISLVVAGGVSARAADPAPVPCTPITTELKAKKLGKLYAYAVNLTNQKVLVNVRSNSQTPSASVMKTITAAAALKFVVKPREVAQLVPYTAKTSVLTLANEPGTLILRGGGDHTLTRVAESSYTTYYLPGQHPVKLRNLATQALAAIPADVQITKIIVDDSFFKGPTWNPNWYPYSRTVGDASPITGLMVDAARKNPDLTDTKYSGYRVSDPTIQAGQFFKKWLGDRAVNAVIVKGATPVSATEITSGESQPITNWIVHALKISDNTETEVIARHTELVMGLKNKYTSVQTMGKRLFTSLGVDSKKLIMKDASGLAPTNRVTAKLLVALMSAAADPQSDIAALPSMMATSGSGTLNGRFLNYNKTTKSYYRVIPAGAIRAKTGYIGSVYALAGIVTTPEGNQIAFAIFARSAPSEGFTVGSGTKQAIDDVVEKLYLCGATL
jgi:D-alanyl-D-alanine carboxypeptidase/D-alanyl-D-alanine-endopeptidase (penicillin-binding protein 4)